MTRRNAGSGADMMKSSRPGIARLVAMLSIPAVVLLLAADHELGRAWKQLEAMPRSERTRLWNNLQRFDKLPSADQRAARDLDRRIAEIENPDQRARYLAVLRRYHLWAGQLPQSKRDQLHLASLQDRMALISKFTAEEKAASQETAPRLVLPLIADLGAFSPDDMAQIYMVWQELPPAERAELEKLPPPQFRNQISRRSLKSRIVPGSLLPKGYNEAEWIARIEKRPRFLRDVPSARGREALREERRRHLALNFYFWENPPKSVSDERLTQFLSQFPEVVRSTFNVFPPEELKRRLSISYRLVFPDREIPEPAKRVDAAAPRPGAAPANAAPPQRGTPPSAAPTAVAKPGVGPTPKPAAPSPDVPF